MGSTRTLVPQSVRRSFRNPSGVSVVAPAPNERSGATAASHAHSDSRAAVDEDRLLFDGGEPSVADHGSSQDEATWDALAHRRSVFDLFKMGMEAHQGLALAVGLGERADRAD
jgi:hypothetical protein